MKVTRRKAVQWGAIGVAGILVPVGTLSASILQTNAINSVKSPETRPFQVPLPIPPVLQPVRSDGEADYYELNPRPGIANILPGLQTPIWGYNGIFPGPTIEARRGRKVVIHQRNELPVPVSMHLHGAVTPPESDGHPMDLILPKDSTPFRESLNSDEMKKFMSANGLGRSLHMTMQNEKEYVYPNNQRASMHWYHDHRMDFTGPQIYKGLVGMYFIRDEDEEALPLPKGDHEIPLMITDRTFNADGSFYYPAVDPTLTKTAGVVGRFTDGMEGDTILVNGAVQPFLQVSNTKYRFRILNASNSALYRLALSSNQPFIQIGSDGGLLPAPATLKTMRIAPAERFDVIIDFSHYPIGTQVILKNLEGEETANEIMRFDVVRQEQDESSIPDKLIPFEKLDPASAKVTRTFHFYQRLNMWTINGQYYDANRVAASPQLGSTEIWEFTSDGEHPVHMHLVNFQILSRDGRAPDPEDAGYKDVVYLNPGEKARVIARFDGYKGLYLFHCHNLEHEDMRMMGQFEVI